MKFFPRIVMLSVLTMLLAPIFAAAQLGVPPIEPLDPNQGEGNLVNIINGIINWAFGLLLLLAAIFIIWAAFLYLTSGGDEEKIKSAKNYIIYAVVAIVVAALARLIVFVVRALLGGV